jgi:uncharacterized protein DUF6397
MPMLDTATATATDSSPDAPVTEQRAARELGLGRRELDTAVRLGHIDTVSSRAPWQRLVPRAEIDRVRAAPGFPASLRERIRLVNATQGAELLRISPARFGRLARGGCLTPVSLCPHRGVIVWRYPAAELRLFAQRHPELLSGPAPRGLRLLLRQGGDWRPRRWRGRHTSLLARQADDPWEKAAVPAAVLDPGALRAVVPDAHERALLHLLRPPLADAREAVVREVLTAKEPDEARWYGVALALALADARRAGPVSGRTSHLTDVGDTDDGAPLGG